MKATVSMQVNRKSVNDRMCIFTLGLSPSCRGEYNVENLKLSWRCHKSCKTQPEGKKLSFIFQKQKSLLKFSNNTHLCILSRSILPKRCWKTRLVFNPFFNGFHSRTLVQVIGNKSADLVLFFSQIRFGRVRSQNFFEKVIQKIC